MATGGTQAGAPAVQAAHDNMLAAVGALAEGQPDGRLTTVDNDVMVAITGSPIGFFNQAVPIRPAAPNGASLREAVEALRGCGRGWTVLLREGVDDPAADALVDHGLVEEEGHFYPAMVLDDLPTDPPPAPADLEVRIVSDEAGFADHVAASGNPPQLVASYLPVALVDRPEATVLTGYLRGTAVATSIAFTTGGTVGVYAVGVHPDHRRKGIGWAMTAAAIDAGRRAGATRAILQSSEMGYSVYAAHGFRSLFNYRAFSDPAPSSG